LERARIGVAQQTPFVRNTGAKHFGPAVDRVTWNADKQALCSRMSVELRFPLFRRYAGGLSVAKRHENAGEQK
jgi:hypothetical protein